jgi:hypothetical protein
MVSSHLKTPLGLRQATGNLDSLDSPWLRLGGNHHLPSYSILCSSSWRLHPNGIFSRDSQGGVSKLSRFGLPRLWELITPSLDIRLRWGLKQSYSSPWELSNGVLHYTCTNRDQVDSWLLVVENQTLTPGLSFNHNLGCRCPNGSYKAILDIYTSRPSNDIKNTLVQGVLTPAIKLLVFGSPGGLQLPTFGSVSFILTLIPKWGCDNLDNILTIGSTPFGVIFKS